MFFLENVSTFKLSLVNFAIEILVGRDESPKNRNLFI